MILIVVKWTVKPQYCESWLERVQSFTEATRAEPGNLWFEWSRSVDRSNEFVLVEAFTEGDAPAEHVNSEHFRTAQKQLPPLLAATPKILNVQTDGDQWHELTEMAVG